MKYLKDNKVLLIKYLLIIISNIIIYILSNFYFRNFEYGSIIMFILLVVDGLIINSYKGVKKFKVYLDILCCFIIGLIMLLFIDDTVMYAYYLFNMFFANNIVFMQSRKSEKFFIKGLQYLTIIFITILCMFLNLIVVYLFFGL